MGVAFDTLKFAQTLRDKAKLSSEQAEGISQAFAEASTDQLATKDDVAALAAKLDGVEKKLEGVEKKLEGVATKLEGVSTKDELAKKLDGFATKDELKAGLAETKAELLKWMFGQTLLIIGVLMALLRFGH